MGTEYTLFNYRTKEMINLGKGPWHHLKNNPELLLWKEEIHVFIFTNFTDENSTEEDKNYWLQIIDMIWNFLEKETEDLDNIDITNDCDDSLYILRSCGFKYVDSRYSDKDLDFLNRHFKEENKLRYNKEEALRYIGTSQLKIHLIK